MKEIFDVQVSRNNRYMFEINALKLGKEVGVDTHLLNTKIKKKSITYRVSLDGKQENINNFKASLLLNE